MDTLIMATVFEYLNKAETKQEVEEYFRDYHDEETALPFRIFMVATAQQLPSHPNPEEMLWVVVIAPINDKTLANVAKDVIKTNFCVMDCAGKHEAMEVIIRYETYHQLLVAQMESRCLLISKRKHVGELR
jgi:hypothetical protein